MTHALIKYMSAGSSGTANFITILGDRVNAMFGQFSDTVGGSSKTAGALILILLVMQIVFRFRKMDEKGRKFIVTSLIILAVFLVGTMFFSHDIWPHYLVGLPIIYSFLLAFCMYLIFTRFGKLVTGATILIIIFINFNPIFFISNLRRPLWEGDASVYRNQLSVVDYVYKQAKDKNFKYVVYTPPVYDYTYQYLFSWYGPKKYKYSPVEKSKLAFFIIEPDYENPKRLFSWLVQRQGDGRVTAIQRVKGGIVVETRTNE